MNKNFKGIFAHTVKKFCIQFNIKVVKHSIPNVSNSYRLLPKSESVKLTGKQCMYSDYLSMYMLPPEFQWKPYH